MQNRHYVLDVYEEYINQNRFLSKDRLKAKLTQLNLLEKTRLFFTYATYSDLTSVKIIVRFGKVNVGSIDPKTGGNAFHFAAKYACYLGNPASNLSFIRFLIRLGVDVNHTDHRGLSGFEQHIIEFFKQKNNPEKWKKLNKPQILAMIKAGAQLIHPNNKIPDCEKTYEEGLESILNISKKEKNTTINHSFHSHENENHPEIQTTLSAPKISSHEAAIGTKTTSNSNTNSTAGIQTHFSLETQSLEKIHKPSSALCAKGLSFFQTRSENILPEHHPEKPSLIHRENSCPSFREKISKVKSLRQPG